MTPEERKELEELLKLQPNAPKGASKEEREKVGKQRAKTPYTREQHDRVRKLVRKKRAEENK